MFEVYHPPPESPPSKRGRPRSLGKPLVLLQYGKSTRVKCIFKGEPVSLNFCLYTCDHYRGKVKDVMICGYK